MMFPGWGRHSSLALSFGIGTSEAMSLAVFEGGWVDRPDMLLEQTDLNLVENSDYASEDSPSFGGCSSGCYPSFEDYSFESTAGSYCLALSSEAGLAPIVGFVAGNSDCNVAADSVLTGTADFHPVGYTEPVAGWIGLVAGCTFRAKFQIQPPK